MAQEFPLYDRPDIPARLALDVRLNEWGGLDLKRELKAPGVRSFQGIIGDFRLSECELYHGQGTARLSSFAKD